MKLSYLEKSVRSINWLCYIDNKYAWRCHKSTLLGVVFTVLFDYLCLFLSGVVQAHLSRNSSVVWDHTVGIATSDTLLKRFLFLHFSSSSKVNDQRFIINWSLWRTPVIWEEVQQLQPERWPPQVERIIEQHWKEWEKKGWNCTQPLSPELYLIHSRYAPPPPSHSPFLRIYDSRPLREVQRERSRRESIGHQWSNLYLCWSSSHNTFIPDILRASLTSERPVNHNSRPENEAEIPVTLSWKSDSFSLSL